uniref:Putative nucleotidyltransferase, ribonuclease H n=1 Tax=Tanacetum cinerariifolium TaxID=118510 RepID=A0A699HBQ8_TANCI|nr:putative nucleotidyltransferase, ribonuclease H [Tanacetum cinerariifolium]
MVTDLEDSKTYTVGKVWSREYMDHGCTKSMSELDRCYTMLQELHSVIVGEELIHKNHEGSQHEGRRIHPTIGNFRGNCASNQSPFNNGRIKEREEEKKEVRVSTTKIFHLKIIINNSVCFLIIDGCSINNLVSRELVNFLKLPMEICPIEGYQVCRVLATIEKTYKVEVLCIVDDIDECHILLGRPWRCEVNEAIFITIENLRVVDKEHIPDVLGHGLIVGSMVDVLKKYEGFRVDVKRKSIKDKVRREVNAVRNWSLPKTLPDVRNIKLADAFQEEDELEYVKPLDGEAKQVTYAVQQTLCSPKHYNDLVTCDINIETCHVLLGRPWQHDMDVIRQEQTLATLVASPKEFQAERKETGVFYAFVVKGVEDFIENAIPAEEANIIRPIMAIEDEPLMMLGSGPNIIKEDFSNDLDGQHSTDEKMVCAQRRTWDPGITWLKILKKHLEDKTWMRESTRGRVLLKREGNDEDMIEEPADDYMEHLVRGKKNKE